MNICTEHATFSAQQLNQDCHCHSLNYQRLRDNLARLGNEADLYRLITEDRPYLCAQSQTFVDQATVDEQKALISALERVIALPLYKTRVMSYSPHTAQLQSKLSGVFLGYDFHLSEEGSKLIEINSNAGGALINTQLLGAQQPCCPFLESKQSGAVTCARAEQAFLAMFLQEWQQERGCQALATIAIVDEDPENQYLWPEFLLFKHLFAQHGIHTLICDPQTLSYHDGALWQQQRKIDLVYNRLTDFSLTEPAQQALCAAYLANAVVVTPNPRTHALYADKRNLVLLSDDDFLQAAGATEADRALLNRGIAKTIAVEADAAESLWAQRKQLFFKPAKGFGSKGAYRGDKLTRRVFSEILQGGYVAQQLVLPSERALSAEDSSASRLKLDLRHYVYQGQSQLLCARLYQGQTTNFRTPGGGFAPVVIC